MKVSCQSCPAKYNIADEKVVGKVVKMRCKKCGATIVINGNELGTAAAAPPPAEAGVDEGWTVNVDDGDQRTMSLEEVADAFRQGVINEETFCWKDGMADWLPLREIEELYAVCAAAAPEAAALPDAGGDAGADLGALFGANDTQVVPTQIAEPSPFASSSMGGGSPLFGSPDPSFPSPAPATAAAARRIGGRGAGADLFGGVASAGGEEDVLGNMPAPALDQKMTGARNENSVLFSLNALTDTKPPAGATTTAVGDGSGLIDIRALSQNMSQENGKKDSSAIDDIMNLGGGGAFSAALTAPVLAPVASDAVFGGLGEGGSGPDKSKMLMFAIIGGCAFLAIAAIVVTLIVVNSKPDPVAINTSASSRVGTTDAPQGAALADPSKGTEPATAQPTDPKASPPNVGGALPKPPGGGAPVIAKGIAPGPRPGGGEGRTEPPPPQPAQPSQPKSLEEAMKGAAGTKSGASEAPKSAGGTAPFDRGAAAAALGAVNVQACKKGDQSGNGRVRVTFDPGGSVKAAEVTEGNFVGTPIGGCVAGKFRGARVPAFAGSEITVNKSFSIN